ncbi:MAG: hypothetical protein KIS84_13570 [Dokdonella sp.]|nr:hypothetical protein [Dokdonella sp.]
MRNPAALGRSLRKSPARRVAASFGGDKLDGPRQFFKAWIDQMNAECLEDGGEDCGGTEKPR